MARTIQQRVQSVGLFYENGSSVKNIYKKFREEHIAENVVIVIS